MLLTVDVDFLGSNVIQLFTRIAAELAGPAGRFVFFYIPHVDFAAHVAGQGSEDYEEAMSIVAAMWERLVMSLPDARRLDCR